MKLEFTILMINGITWWIQGNFQWILCFILFDILFKFVMILSVLSNDIYLPRHQKTNLSVQKQLSHEKRQNWFSSTLLRMNKLKSILFLCELNTFYFSSVLSIQAIVLSHEKPPKWFYFFGTIILLFSVKKCDEKSRIWESNLRKVE